MNYRHALISIVLFFVGSTVHASPVQVGEKAPEVEIARADGSTFKLSALHGKDVILHFWATWCPACKVEMPHFSKMLKADGSIVFLGISVDKESERAAATNMMAALGLPWAMLNDAKSNGLGKPRSLPLTYVIDAEGVVKKITANYFASASSSSTVH
jgi:cytochrome c biogenesis protein CcmG/thiol:disulfide interchange protein DsbE